MEMLSVLKKMIPTSGNDRKAQEKLPFPPGNRWEMEAVLRGGRSRNYLGDFWRFPTGKNRNLAGRQRKFSGIEYCFDELVGIPRNRLFPCRVLSDLGNRR
jgi:hypothetical protein